MAGFYALTEKLFRLKTVGSDFLETQLKRCLSTLDITMLGVGHMIGAGIYVLTGAVVRNTAGAGVVLSFIFAGVASLLSALCYAEFGSRVPKAGSAYTYTYVTIGEFWAFIIGWNIILEHMLGAAAVARSWSGYLDSLLGHVIKNSTIDAVGEMEGNHILGDYPDFVAFLVIFVVAGFMGYGAKTSTNFNTIFTVVNMFVIAFVVIFGLTFADFTNWTNYAPSPKGLTGFMPYGFAGVLAGAGSCFFAYVGFDGIATAGEEASDPGKSIPRATFISMIVVTGSYVLMSSALTLMVPFYEVHPTSAFADAFETRGALWAKYVVAIGALSGMTTSLVGSLFALPRCVYAMANDGLIFRSLAHVHPKTQVPTLAVAVFGAATSIIALLFDVETLVEFLSIGTLMAYTIVSCSVIILRYQPAKDYSTKMKPEVTVTSELNVPVSEPVTDEKSDDKAILMDEIDIGGTLKSQFHILKPWTDKYPPGTLVSWATLGLVIFVSCLTAVATYGDLLSWYGMFFMVVFGFSTLASFCIIYIHHQNTEELRFRVPLVPLVPVMSVVINLIFMLHLSYMTWLRLAIWLSVGCLVYFFYGIKHSQENKSQTDNAGTTNYNTLSSASTPAIETVKLPESEPSVTIEKLQPEPKNAPKNEEK